MPIGNILSKEHINALTVELLQDYHKQTFTESNIRVFVAGNVEGYDSYFQFAQCPKEIGSKEDFDIIQCLKKESRKDELVSRKDCKVRFELRESALQSSLILCKNNIGFLHENRRNFEVLSMIYGGYFGSRLMKNLREEKGYTYNVFCNSIFYENKALFYIEADVIVEKTKEAIETCYKEMLLLQNELVDENELSLVKSYMLGELLRSVDGYVDYQKRYALWNDFGLDEKEMQMMVDSIRAVTSQNIQTLAKLYLVPETFTTVVVGKM
ncbi:MAG: insulinase family protein [Bacteroidales bacterium]|nr:insulinase family protein [Bacteroidales bacterium]